jgi:hypothetical protein
MTEVVVPSMWSILSQRRKSAGGSNLNERISPVETLRMLERTGDKQAIWAPVKFDIPDESSSIRLTSMHKAKKGEVW